MPPRIAAIVPFVLSVTALALAVSAAPGSARAAGPEAAFSSQVETEWSPENQAVGQPGALVLTHTHSGTVTAGSDAIGLRGSFDLERSIGLSGPDRSQLRAAATLEMEAQIDPETVLRAGFGVVHDDESEILVLLDRGIGTRTAALDLTASVGLSRRWGDTLIGIEAARTGFRAGDTEFSGLPLAPQRLSADTDMLGGAVSLEHALSPSLAVLAATEITRLAVSPVDSLLFGRVPADRLRLAAGLRLQQGDRLEAELRLGADIVSGEIVGLVLGEDHIVRPYGYGAIGLSLREGFTLAFSAEAGTGFADPLDGFADWRWRLAADAEMAVSDRLTLSAGLHAEGGDAVLAAIPLSTEIGAQAGLRYAIAPGLSLGTRLGLVRETGLAGQDTEMLTVAFAVSAEL